MKKTIVLFSLCFVLLVAGCAVKEKIPVVKLTGSTEYRNGEGMNIRAEYYMLDDNTLHFVKLYIGNGEKITLPLSVSASGSRYTDDFQYVWWIKGKSAWFERRSDDGTWVADGTEFTAVN